MLAPLSASARASVAAVAFGATFALSGPASGQDASLSLRFVPHSPEDSAAAAEYSAIWSEDGQRIVDALQKYSGLRFGESEITVTVREAMSFSGGPGRPMRLRSSYDQATKRGTLVHELGHRLQGRYFSRDDEDHPLLFLYLYDVWVEVYGKEFADGQVAVESRRRGYYDYEAAWHEALALTPEERQAAWRTFLAQHERR